MLQNGSLNSNIRPNSLAVDKELTRQARDLARRINQRCIEVQHKADDLENYSREVILRVDCAASKMANLKNFKAVKQVISTENVLKPEDMRVDEKSNGLYSTDFLESFKKAIITCGQTVNSLENPAMFPTTSQYNVPAETNGYTNGHTPAMVNGHGINGSSSVDGSSINGHRPSSNGFEESSESEDERVVLKNQLEEKLKIDVGQVKKKEGQVVDVDEQKDNQRLSPPSPIDEPVNKRDSNSSATTTHSSPDQQNGHAANDSVENPLFLPQTMPIAPPSDPKRLSATLESSENNTTAEPSPLPNVVMRSTAMASVIGEIREKNAAKPKFFDTDSDSDTEPLSQAKPAAPPKKVSAVEPVPAPKVTQPTPVKPDAKPFTSAQVSAKVEPSHSAPAQPKLPRRVAGFEPKVEMKPRSNNIFDSDSDSDTEFTKPPVKPVSKPVSKPVKEETPVGKPAASKTNVAAESTTSTTPAAPVNNTVPLAKQVIGKSPPTTKTVIGKSLFSSDSDSDDDFLKSFSKPKSAPVPVEKSVAKPMEKPVAKPLTAAVTNSVTVKPVAPKVVDTPTMKSTIPPAAATTTTIPRKVETKVEAKVETKKPATQSLFDDSDSDSDLFTSKPKPKALIDPKKEITPPSKVVEAEATLPESIMEPTPSEQTEPASSKKGSTSEKMSAKISLIADLQKTFRLPGAVPNIPVKNTPVTEEASQEEEATVGTILKGRCRGPSNRRPPTRVPK